MQSDVPSSSQSTVPMSPMSECDSTVFSEGSLATIKDIKDGKNQHGIEQTSFQNGMFLCLMYISVPFK